MRRFDEYLLLKRGGGDLDFFLWSRSNCLYLFWYLLLNTQITII